MDKLKQIREALEAAGQFIRNGVEFGYITLPDRDTPDSAHETPGMIAEALASLDGIVLVDEGRLMIILNVLARYVIDDGDCGTEEALERRVKSDLAYLTGREGEG